MAKIAKPYDVVVIGLGAAGSAALYALAKAGAKVAGIDRFAPPHAMGSSHGETRLLRTAYSEGPFYVPLVKRAITLWKALERDTDAALFAQTGVVYAGPASGSFMAGAREAAREGRVALGPARGLAPWFALPPDWPAMLDKAGGTVFPERAIGAFLKGARRRGATIFKNCRCEAIDRSGADIAVETPRGRLMAKRVIVTTGAWIDELVPELAPLTTVERRVLHWFADPMRRFTRKAGFRPFAIATEDEGLVYGFPANAKGEVKVAEHRTVQIIRSPDALDRRIGRRDTTEIAPLVRRFMPGLGKRMRSTVCMYPMAPDERFILAPLPRDRRVIVGAGLSGHGFKFAPAIGEVLANLVLGRKQKVDIGAFGWPGVSIR